MTKIPWNNKFLDEFENLAGLTLEETQILRTRIAGYTRVKQAQTLHMSESKVDRLIKKCKIKYDKYQPYSDILPKRKDLDF